MVRTIQKEITRQDTGEELCVTVGVLYARLGRTNMLIFGWKIRFIFILYGKLKR